jgi:hypothetical protein
MAFARTVFAGMSDTFTASGGTNNSSEPKNTLGVAPDIN